MDDHTPEARKNGPSANRSHIGGAVARRTPKVWFAVAIAAAVVGGGVFAVSKFAPADSPLSKTLQDVIPGASDCPGARGSNSSWPDLAGVVGRTAAVELEQLEAAVNSFTVPPFSGEAEIQLDRETVINNLLADAENPEHSSKFVPDGGDAKFAQALCDAQEEVSAAGRQLKNLIPTGAGGDSDLSTEDQGLLARMVGRSICQTAGTDSGEEATRKLRTQADKATANPTLFKADFQRELDETEATAASLEPSPAKDSLTATVTTGRKWLNSTTDEEFARDNRVPFEINEAAFRYQCPRKLELGYGPDCGPFTGISRGGDPFTGTIKLRNNKIDCSEGEQILTEYMRGPGKAESRGYLCTRPSANDDEAELYFISCGYPSESPEWDAKDPEGVIMLRNGL